MNHETKTSPQQEELPPSHTSVEPPAKRARTSTVREASIEFWRENGTWPTEEQEKPTDSFREFYNKALAKKRPLSHASLSTDTTQTESIQQVRDHHSVPYKHPFVVELLKDHGSFMFEDDEGITAESKTLCQTLLQAVQVLPQDTLFSDDKLFKKTCERLRNENETKVIRDIAQLIVPSAEILADRGAEHLEILRETTNACWINACTFIDFSGLHSVSGSQSGSPEAFPQPDFGLGFKRSAFSREQLQKLQLFIGDPLTDCSYFAATYNMYFPFLTSEVICEAGLGIAERKNAYTQTIILRGLCKLFSLVGRENELHRQINGFSISHNEEKVHIWGHYAVVDGDDVRCYRRRIRWFGLMDLEGKERWTAYRFVKNLYDLWVPEHFKRICSVIDMFPTDASADAPGLG